ncbi:LptF/LptG family permease [Kiloniella laminariae]|uniref:LptF/LptG family permease n=1 Tax=Kiloniella laminariae TaxID=454162 RepID=UPI000361CC79|nr:LptF/LptG family permease [Kiloniella laminariae]
MQIISRYMLLQLVLFAISVAISLAVAVWLAQSLRFVDMIVNDGLPASTFFYFVILLMPYFLVIVIPVATFCSVLFIYNKLNTDSELIVLRAAGFSQFQLAGPGIKLGVLAMLCVVSINLYFLPASYREFRELQHYFRDNLSPVLLKEGKFNTLNNEYTIYFKEKTPAGELKGLLVHDSSTVGVQVTYLAETGALLKEQDDFRAILWNASRQEIDPETGRLSIAYSDKYVLKFANISQDEGDRWLKPRERFLSELLFPDSENPRDLDNFDELVAAGHYRISSPLFTLAMAFIALACLLSGEFSRRGQLGRIMVAICCMGLMMLAMFLLKDITEKNSNLIPVLYIWPLAVIMISVFVLQKAKRNVSLRNSESTEDDQKTESRDQLTERSRG